jgi:quercetin dioxygenase-like cupin family protein
MPSNNPPAGASAPRYPAADAHAARRVEDWGSLTWLASRAIGNTRELTVGRVTITRGESNPRHTHPGSEEILYLLSGRLEHTLGDETYSLEPGDTLAIPPGVFHNARSVGDVDADMIVAYSTGVRDFVLESATAAKD